MMTTLILAASMIASATDSGAVTRTMSVYSDSLHGQTMANGEVYDKNRLTAASNDFPLNSRVRISYNGKSVVVRITDRMARRFTNRRIDASRALWNRLTDGASSGLRSVRVERV